MSDLALPKAIFVHPAVVRAIRERTPKRKLGSHLLAAMLLSRLRQRLDECGTHPLGLGICRSYADWAEELGLARSQQTPIRTAVDLLVQTDLITRALEKADPWGDERLTLHLDLTRAAWSLLASL